MSSVHPLKIVISGWYGHWNAGDDAILQVFVDQVTLRLKCNIVVLSERPENIHKTAQVVSVFHLIPSIKGIVRSLIDGSFFRHLNNIRTCDLFVLGGGGLLRDNTNWRNLIRLLDEIWISKLFGRKVMLYAIGVGPFKSRLGKFVIRNSVKMCDLITVRSDSDAFLLQEIGVASERIHVVADPAFLLQAEESKDQALIDLLSGPKKIGVFPTFSLIMEGQDLSHVTRLAIALDRLVEEEGVQFVVLPMQVSKSEMDDVQMANAIKSAMKHPEAIQIYDKRLTPSELKWVTNKTLLNITLRLHAMIFSIGANAPVVAINYEPKVGNVFGALGCPQYLVEMDEALGTALVSSVKQCMSDLSNYSQTITDFSPAARVEASRTFDLMQALFPVIK